MMYDFHKEDLVIHLDFRCNGSGEGNINKKGFDQRDNDKKTNQREARSTGQRGAELFDHIFNALKLNTYCTASAHAVVIMFMICMR